MEYLKDLAGQSPGIAFGLLCFYFYTKLVESYLADRKEWNQTLLRLLDRYDARLIENVQALERAASQDHSLRTKIGEWMTGIENLFRSIESFLRGPSGRGGND